MEGKEQDREVGGTVHATVNYLLMMFSKKLNFLNVGKQILC